MLNRFTKREKALLLVLLIVFVLSVGVRFFVIPTWTAYNDAVNQREEIQAEYDMMQEQAAQTDALTAQLQDLQNTAKESSENGDMPYMTLESVHRLFTDLSAANGLNCFQMDLSDYAQTRLVTAAEKKALESDSSLKDTIGVPVYTVEVSLRLNGSQEGYESFLNALSEKSNVSVESFQIVVSDQDRSVGADFVYAQNILTVKAMVLMDSM